MGDLDFSPRSPKSFQSSLGRHVLHPLSFSLCEARRGRQRCEGTALGVARGRCGTGEEGASRGRGRRAEALTEEAEAWARRRGCARAPALLLWCRRRQAARARRQSEAAEVPVPAGAGGRLVPGAHARPSPCAPADSCSWALALGGLGPSALRPLGLPPLHLYSSCPRCGSFRNCSPLAPCLAAFPFPGPFLSTLPPPPRTWGEGLRRARVERPEEEARPRSRRRVGGPWGGDPTPPFLVLSPPAPPLRTLPGGRATFGRGK